MPSSAFRSPRKFAAASYVYKRQLRDGVFAGFASGLVSCAAGRTAREGDRGGAVSHTHLRAHETPEHLVCRLLPFAPRVSSRQRHMCIRDSCGTEYSPDSPPAWSAAPPAEQPVRAIAAALSLIHISEPTRLLSISYAVFCLSLPA